MTRLAIAEKFSLPLDWLLATTVVFGTRGSGKTTFGSIVAEELDRAKQRFCAIDIKGDYYGLKSTADGKGDGIPVVIFGGDHADLPLEEGAGEFVGQTVAGLQQSVIIDLEHFSKGKQIRFLAAFFAALYHTNRDPMLLIADEAQRYAPQKPITPEAQVCLGAVEDIGKLGRKHGIGVLFITQRGSSLNKEVSELCDMMIAFRSPGVRDQSRISEWLEANATREQHDEVMAEGVLSGLDTGRAVFASNHPEFRTFRFEQVRLRWTFDSCATPKIGQRRKEPKRLAAPDLDAIRVKMADAIERAKENDPKALREMVAGYKVRLQGLVEDLEARDEALARAHAAMRVEQVERLVIQDKQLEAIKDLTDGLNRWVESANMLLRSATGEVAEAADGIAAALVTVANQPRIAVLDDAFVPTPAQLSKSEAILLGAGLPPSRPGHYPRSLGPGEPGVFAVIPPGMNGGMRKVLIAIVEQGPCTKEQLSVLTGYKRSSRDTHLSKLKAAGYITEETISGFIATAAGRAAVAGEAQRLPIGRALRDYWRERLKGGEAKVFAIAVKAYPHGVSPDAISEQTGYQRSSRDTFITRLAARKLVSRQGKQVVASRHLFEGA